MKSQKEQTNINNVIYKQENDILDGLRNLKETLMLRRKRDLEYSEQDMRNIDERRKMMKQYTEFLPNGQVDEVALTENDFYKGKLPDNYFIPIEPRLFDRDVYKTTIIDKIIKPIVTEDGKSMIFNFKIENLIEYNGIILSLKIENQNENNWLQLDGKEYNLIKSIKLLFNNILVESHENWNEVWRTTDMIYSTNYSGTTKDYIDQFTTTPNNNGKFLQRNTGGLLLSPEQTGSNLIFNPPNDFKSYLQIGKITNGKIDFTQTNVLNIEIPIKLYKFGNFTTSNEVLKPNNLMDLRDYDNITLAIEMNPDAFFVPVFNATIHDLVNVAVDGSWYSENRKLRDQLENLKKLNKNLKSSITSLNKNLTDSTIGKYRLDDKIKSAKDILQSNKSKYSTFLRLFRDELLMNYVDITETTNFKETIVKSKVFEDTNDLSDPKILLNITFGNIFDDEFSYDKIFNSLNKKGIKVIVVNLVNKSDNVGKASTNPEYVLYNDRYQSNDNDNDIHSNTYKNEIHFVVICYTYIEDDDDENGRRLDAVEVLLKKQNKIFEIDKMKHGSVDYSSMFKDENVELLKANNVNITTDFLLNHINTSFNYKFNIHPFSEVLSIIDSGNFNYNSKVKHIRQMKNILIDLFIDQFKDEFGYDSGTKEIKDLFKKSFSSDSIFITKILKYFCCFNKIICVYEGSKTILINNENTLEDLKKDIDLRDTLILYDIYYNADNNGEIKTRFSSEKMEQIKAEQLMMYNSLDTVTSDGFTKYKLIKNQFIFNHKEENIGYGGDENDTEINYIKNNKPDDWWDGNNNEFIQKFNFEKVNISNKNNVMIKATVPKFKILNKIRVSKEYFKSLEESLSINFILEILKDYSAENTVKIINDYYEDTIEPILINEAPIVKQILTNLKNNNDNDDNRANDFYKKFLYIFVNFSSILKNFKLWNSRLLNSSLIKTEFSLSKYKSISASDRYIPFSVNDFDDNKVNLPFEDVVKTSRTLSQYIIDNNFFDETSRRALEIVNLLNIITEMDKNSGSHNHKLTLMDYNSDIMNNLNIAFDANDIDKIYYVAIDELADKTVGPVNFLLYGLLDLFIYLSKSTILKSSSKLNTNLNNIERVFSLIDCVINRNLFENTKDNKEEAISILLNSFNINMNTINNKTKAYFDKLIESIVNVVFDGEINKTGKGGDVDLRGFATEILKFKELDDLDHSEYIEDNGDGKTIFNFDFPLIDYSLFNFSANNDITKFKLVSYNLNFETIIVDNKASKGSLMYNAIKKAISNFTSKLLSTENDDSFDQSKKVIKNNTYIYVLTVFIFLVLNNNEIEYDYNLNKQYEKISDINHTKRKGIKVIETRLLEEHSEDINMYGSTVFLEKIIKIIAEDIRITFNILKSLKNKIDPTCFTILNKLYNSYLYLIKALITQEDDYSNEGIDNDNYELRKFWKILYYINHLFYDFKLVIEEWENNIQDKIVEYIRKKSFGLNLSNNDDADIDMDTGNGNNNNKSLNKFIRSGKLDKILDFTKLKIGFNLKQFKIVKILVEELLNVKLNGGVSIQNEINNFLDPDYIDKLEYKLTTKIKSTLDNPWITQYEYTLLNNEKRMSNIPKIDKSYIVTDAILVAKSLPLDTKYDSRIETFSLQNQPKVFLKKVYSEVFDVNKDFSIPINNNVNRLFIYFTDFILEKYPTYRKSTFVSVPLETFALIHGDKIYPETFFIGKISDSTSNIMFLKELAAALGYGSTKESVELMERETPFNRLNYAIESSTTGFITEKLYLKDILKKYENFEFKEMNDMFLFNNDTNKMIDAVFGYDQEVISKFILGFDLNKVRNEFKLLGNKEELTEFRFTFDYNKLQKFKNRLKINIITDYNIKV